MNTLHDVRSRYSLNHTCRGTMNHHPDDKAQQHFAGDVNINQIMERAKRGVMPVGQNRPPMFGDFSNVTCYQDALERVNMAKQSFETLPAKVRDRFRNNPQLLFDFIGDENNRAEAIELGLVEKPNPAPAEPAKQ